MSSTESVKKHPRKFRREKAKRPQSGEETFPVDARCTAGAVQKVVALQGHSGKLESGEARIPGALSSAQRGTALCTSGNFGDAAFAGVGSPEKEQPFLNGKCEEAPA